MKCSSVNNKHFKDFEKCRDEYCGGSGCDKICLESDSDRKHRLYQNCLKMRPKLQCDGLKLVGRFG